MTDGITLGWLEGTEEGSSDGPEEGSADGTEVGLLVGLPVVQPAFSWKSREMKSSPVVSPRVLDVMIESSSLSNEMVALESRARQFPLSASATMLPPQ